MEFWNEPVAGLCCSKRRLPKGVRRPQSCGRLVARGAAAGPVVCSVGVFADRAVAVDALDLDGGTHLAVQLGVAVRVLDEMAIDAVHALFQVNVEQVDRHSSRRFRGLLGRVGAGTLLDFLGILMAASMVSGVDLADHVARVVEEIALAVLFEHGAEDPAVAVEIGELGVLQAAG